MSSIDEPHGEAENPSPMPRTKQGPELTRLRRDGYLKKAEDADRLADQATDAKQEGSWGRIAASYRELAMTIEHASRLFKIRRFLGR